MKKLTIAGLISLLIWNPVLSQQTDWINYTCANALWDFAETDDYYWASTNGGLVKINKSDSSIEILTKANSPLSYNSVGPLCTDSHNNLWVGSQSNNSQEGGILKFDGENWESVDLEAGFWSTMITGLTADNNDNLWFGMGQGIAKYDGNTVEYKQIISDLMPYGLSLKKIAFDNNDNVWFLEENGRIRILENGNFNSLKGVVLSPYLEQDSFGDFWILENNKLKCFSGIDNISNLNDGDTSIVNDNIVFKDSITPQIGDTIRFFHIDKNDCFYVAFQSKLGIRKNGKWQYLTHENSQLPLGNFHNLFIDSKENFWASVCMPEIRFRIYSYNISGWNDITQKLSNSGLHNNYVKNLGIDDADDKWIVTYSAENILTWFNGSEWTDYDSLNMSNLNLILNLGYDSDSLKIWNDGSVVISYDSKSNIWSVSDNCKYQSSKIKIDALGNVWWGTSNGLKKYNGNHWETFLTGNSIASICFDNTNTLYASTLPPVDEPGLLFSYKNDTWDTLATCSGDEKWIHSMTVDNDNNLWFGVLYRRTIGHEYGDGLYKYNGQEFIHYHIYNSDMPGNSVVYVFADTDNNIWVGTYGDGLSVFKNNAWINYNASNSPLSGTSVEIIENDSDGNIWVSCQFSGITVIPYSEFNTSIKNIETNTLYDEVKVYPNPTSGDLSIDFMLKEAALINLTVYNINGKKILRTKQKYYPVGVNSENLNLSNYTTKGIYFLDINIGINKVTKKILIE
jgi:ligand-binding sensor domain-containing protein